VSHVAVQVTDNDELKMQPRSPSSIVLPQLYVEHGYTCMCFAQNGLQALPPRY
jgi:hypothetical protein